MLKEVFHYKLKDTMEAYFCYRHTLLQTITLSTLFYLFQNYTCVLLMDVLKIRNNKLLSNVF